MPRRFAEPYIVPALTFPPTHTFIVLHGRGDDPSVFGSNLLSTPLGGGLTFRTALPGVKFVFPAAPLRPATPMSETGPATQWFDVYSLARPEERWSQQVPGITESVDHIFRLVRDEVAQGVRREHVIVGGMGQGCATALMALLLDDERLAGVVAMCGWLPFKDAIRIAVDMGWPDGGKERTHICGLNYVRQMFDKPPWTPWDAPPCIDTPLYLGHGRRDSIVRYGLAEDAGLVLETVVEIGHVTIGEYSTLGHGYSPDMLYDVIRFLGERCGVRIVLRSK